jgi:2'-5' RNA ligase
MNASLKRMFFALDVKAPWPEKMPMGRFLDEEHRHITLSFLGHADFGKMQKSLDRFPYPPFKVGFAGVFSELLLLPPRHPHVAAWKVQWIDDAISLEPYQKILEAWLLEEGFMPDIRDNFLPHVTICRSPFHPRQWEKAFRPLPMIASGLHLFESMGSLRYLPLWSCPVKPPFEEYEHTADVAYRIYGESILQLKKHAYVALAFKSPEILTHLSINKAEPAGVEDIIIDLNEAIARVDEQMGTPFKAVSFHGDIQEEEGVLKWEMIVDV